MNDDKMDSQNKVPGFIVVYIGAMLILLWAPIIISNLGNPALNFFPEVETIGDWVYGIVSFLVINFISNTGIVLVVLGLCLWRKQRKQAPKPETDQPLESKTKFKENKTRRKMK